ncbi:MAG TPA: carboxymuconolactone decarboxylase family protein [Thermoleophilia bacterium]|nr:carboxymuconolactone decarboxylase family protein [Thermoleophilia bacterium]
MHEVGMAMRRRLLGDDGAEALAKAEAISPKMARWMIENLFGEVFGDDTLDLKTRSLCTLSALIVLGNEGPLGNHIRGALRIGITKEELSALITHMLWYAGLPAAFRALGILMSELAKQK